MSEFEGKSLSQLKTAMIGLVAYRQGCIDSFEIIKDNHNLTRDFYTKKIETLQEEIDKLVNKNE